MTRLWLVAVMLLAPLAAQAEMPSEAQIKAVADAWRAKTPAPGLGAITMAEAVTVQERFNALIAPGLGGVVGYKAGLTNPAVQRRFNHDQPIRGTLYEKMIVAGPARVPAGFGTRPLFEADLVAVVGDVSRLYSATTALEALAALSELRPFIELPDLLMDPKVPLNGPVLVSGNVGARLGVLGAPVRIAASAEAVTRLAEMKVELLDQTGAVLGGGKGADVLGNPLNAVLWLVGSLRAAGIPLRNGDLLSLGSFSALLPPRAGLTVTARYTGLAPTPVEVKVTFD